MDKLTPFPLATNYKRYSIRITMMAFIIREAKLKDAQGVLKLRLKLLKAFPNAFRTTFVEGKKKTVNEQRKLIKSLVFRDNSTMLLAEIKGSLVGMVSCLGGNHNKTQHLGTVVGLGVLPKFCGNGIGRALMEKLIHWAEKGSPIERLEVNVYSDNIKAVKLYKRLGFITEGLQKKASKREDGTYQDIVNLVLFFFKAKNILNNKRR